VIEVATKVSNTLTIIKVLYKFGGCATIDQLCAELSRKKNYVHSYLSILKEKGMVKKVVVENGKILYCLEG
jgi:Fe2+ or Zn2+ uptake regulation protein